MFRTIAMIGALLCGNALQAGVLTPAQQVEMLENVKQLQREVRALRSELNALKAQPRSGGLKSEDYGNRAPGNASQVQSGSGGWVKESMKGVMEQVERAKNQIQKHNQEVEKLEKELP